METTGCLFRRPRRAQPTRGSDTLPVALLLDNVRSMYNVGAFFRTADAAAVEKLYLTGITSYPPKNAIRKTALGAEETVAWEHDWDSVRVLDALRARGYELAAVETSVHAVDLFDWTPRFPVCVIFGHEVEGIRAGGVGALRHARAHSHAGREAFAQRRHRRRRGGVRAVAQVPGPACACDTIVVCQRHYRGFATRSTSCPRRCRTARAVHPRPLPLLGRDAGGSAGAGGMPGMLRRRADRARPARGAGADHRRTRRRRGGSST